MHLVDIWRKKAKGEIKGEIRERKKSLYCATGRRFADISSCQKHPEAFFNLVSSRFYLRVFLSGNRSVLFIGFVRLSRRLSLALNGVLRKEH